MMSMYKWRFQFHRLHGESVTLAMWRSLLGRARLGTKKYWASQEI